MAKDDLPAHEPVRLVARDVLKPLEELLIDEPGAKLLDLSERELARRRDCVQKTAHQPVVVDGLHGAIFVDL